MSEQRIQKALTFLKNPKIASMTHEKKIEFLRTKLPPQEMEEVLRRYKESDDFSQFFDQTSQNNNQAPTQQIPNQIPQQMPPQVIQPQPVQATSSKWSFGWLGVVASAIIGAIGSAMFLNAQPKDKVRRRKNQPRSAESISNSSDLDSQRESANNELVSQRSQGENQLIERLITQQAEAFEGLSKQIASLQFAIETLKRDQAQLMTQQSSQPQINPPEIIEPAMNFKNKEEINEIFQEFLVNTTNVDQKSTALKNMRMWFQNMVNNPNDQNKNKINTTNMQYKNSIAGNKIAPALLEIVGLTLKGNIWEFNPLYVEPLRNLLDLVSDEVAKMPPMPPPKFNSAQPWLPQKQQESAKIEENKGKDEQDKKSLDKKEDEIKIEEIKKEETGSVLVEEVKESEQIDQAAIQNA